MKFQLLVIPGALPDLNEYTNTNRSHWSKGNKSKQEETEAVSWYCKQQHIRPVGTTPKIVYRWICKDRKKDKDNIAFAKKFINDGLQLAGVLDGDGWKHIGEFQDEFFVDPAKPRIEVEIYESIE